MGSQAPSLEGLQPAELAELADELRAIWRALSRGTHLSGGAEQPQRQQFWLLGMIEAGPRRMSDLAAAARTSQASLTGIVGRLEERGFVERVRSDYDRRVVEVGLTPAGRAEVRQVRADVAARLARLLEPLDSAERAEMLRLFRKMTAQPRSDCTTDRHER